MPVADVPAHAVADTSLAAAAAVAYISPLAAFRDTLVVTM
jgi:hypothetical protein